MTIGNSSKTTNQEIQATDGTEIRELTVAELAHIGGAVLLGSPK